MNEATRRYVIERAQGRCEYCHKHQDDEFSTFHVEHIIAIQHEGSDSPTNLSLSCRACNSSKGPNVAGIWEDQVIPLFNPRRQLWNDHFRWQGSRLTGTTPIGLVTVKILKLNAAKRIESRSSLIAEGRFPPPDDLQD